MQFLRKLGKRLRAFYFWLKRKIMGELDPKEIIERHGKTIIGVYSLLKDGFEMIDNYSFFIIRKEKDNYLEFTVGIFRVVIMASLASKQSVFETYLKQVNIQTGKQELVSVPSAQFRSTRATSIIFSDNENSGIADRDFVKVYTDKLVKILAGD